MGTEMRLGATLAAIVSGEATAVVGRTLVALIDAPPTDAIVEAIWGVAESEGGFDAALSALGGDGFAGLPSLAVFGWEGTGCRLVIRGDVGLEVNGRDGMQLVELQGGAVRSWAEHTFDEVGSIRAWVGATRVATAEFLGYAIDRGIAPARGVDVLAPGSEVARPAKRARKRPAKAASRVAMPASVAAAVAAAAGPAAAGQGAAEPAVDPAGQPESVPAPGAAADAPLAPPAGDPPAPVEPVAEPGAGGDVQPGEGAAVASDALADLPPPPLAPASMDTIYPGPGGDDLAEDAVPGLADLPPPPSPPSPPGLLGSAPAPAPPPPPPGGGAFDHLFGATEYRSVEDAAIRVDEPEHGGHEPEPSTADLGPDHDGMTVTAAELKDLLGRNPGPPPASGSVPSGFNQLAIRCGLDHLNPPHASVCRACGQSIRGYTPIKVPKIDLGVFRFTDGTKVPVVKPMLIGRSPKMSGPIAGELPDLVSVASPAQDISRTHVEIRVEGWQVMIVDKGSTNGTTVILPGREPQRLRPDQPFPLPVGGRVNLAGEAEFVFEVGP